MNEQLFASQSKWTASGADPTKFFGDYATQLGLDTTAFNACLDSGEAATAVKGDMLAGEQLGVSATPYFFIDKIPIRGGLSVEGFSAIIDYVAAGGSKRRDRPGGQLARPGQHADGQGRRGGVRGLLPTPSRASSPSKSCLSCGRPTSTPDRCCWSSTPGRRARTRPVPMPPRRRVRRPAEQGLGDVHQALLREQDKWTQAADPQPLFSSYAQGLSLDTAKFEQCLELVPRRQ